MSLTLKHTQWNKLLVRRLRFRFRVISLTCVTVWILVIILLKKKKVCISCFWQLNLPSLYPTISVVLLSLVFFFLYIKILINGIMMTQLWVFILRQLFLKVLTQKHQTSEDTASFICLSDVQIFFFFFLSGLCPRFLRLVLSTVVRYK